MANPCVDELLKYSYELGRSVVRPEETADWFSERLYVSTLLDERLLPDILADNYDLVLVTGNPGDGKSAFMRRLLQPGGTTTHGGRQIRVRHDATEPCDISDRSASALDDLREFLADFTNESWNPEALSSQMFVVGINKGLLVRAFTSDSSMFPRLRDAIRGSDTTQLIMAAGVRIRVVDLNDRSEVVLGESDDLSLFDRLVHRLVKVDNWENQEGGCGDCDAESWCPFLANARLLRRPEVCSRLRLLWLVQQLEGERHSTLRDLLAGLAYILVGHQDMFHEQDNPLLPAVRPCDFVAAEKTVGSYGPLLSRLLWNSTFLDSELLSNRMRVLLGHAADSPAIAYGMAPAVIRDHINVLDPGSLSTPAWDDVEVAVVRNPRQFVRHLCDGACVDLERSFAEGLDMVLRRLDDTLDEAEPSEPAYSTAISDYDMVVQFLVEYAKRRHFFLGQGVGEEEMTPYTCLPLFLKASKYCWLGLHEDVEAYEHLVHDVLPHAIHRAERVPLPSSPDDLHLRWSGRPASVGAVQVLKSDGAAVSVGPSRDEYVEYSPHYLSFDPGVGEGGVALRISLRTLEGIKRIAEGYSDEYGGVPRTNQFRNFRDSLRGRRSNRLLLVQETDPDSAVSISVSAGRMRFD